MTLRNGQPVTIKLQGVTDAIDGTNGQPGSLQAAVNLVPAMHTRNVWVPRPAVEKAVDFADTGQGEALIQIGDRLWGFIQSNSFTGKSTPFCYDLSVGGFVPIAGMTVTNLPDSTSNEGEWIPPILAQIGAYIIFTHPGFEMPNAFGWIDMTGLADTATGTTTAGNAVIASLSKNALLGGWRPGMRVSGPGVPVGASIAWVANDGLSLALSAPATASGTAVTLSVAGGTPAAPLWGAGNLNDYSLPDVATCVALFHGRAWYAVGNAEVFSDAGDPLQRTNANQVLTIQNGLKITASATIPFSNTTQQGGVVQGLILFQADAAMWQITGDAATSNLSLNFVAPMGTFAPLSIVTVPPALRFIAPDGMRQLSADGTVSPPLGANGDGVAMPFVNVIYPSRMCAAYNEDVYRVTSTGYISVGGSVLPVEAAAEYFYHEKLGVWSGPHTDPARLICSRNDETGQHGFFMFRLTDPTFVLGSGRNWLLVTGMAVMLGERGTVPGPTSLWFSDTRPMIGSQYRELGLPLNWVLETSLLPDTGGMVQSVMTETAIALALSPTGSCAVSAIDDRGVTLDTVAVRGFPSPPGSSKPIDAEGSSVWNTMLWGDPWGARGAGAILVQRQIDWHTSLVCKQMSLCLTGLSDANTAIGNINLRVQRSGYLLLDPARVSTGIPGIPNFAVP